MLLQRLRVRCKINRFGTHLPAADDQSRFSHAITRIKIPRLKTARLEPLRETFHRFAVYGLSPVVCRSPTAQVQRRALIRADLPNAKVICEVRCAAMCAAVFRNSGEPSNRGLKKRCRRKQHTGITGEDRLQDAVNESHVVEIREPGDGHTLRTQLETIAQELRILNQIAVRDHDSFGSTGRTGGVLEKSQSFAT